MGQVLESGENKIFFVLLSCGLDILMDDQSYNDWTIR
jgi:hypothetical protein